jgi:hypothetical protein
MAVGSACFLATAIIVAWKMPRHNPGQPAPVGQASAAPTLPSAAAAQGGGLHALEQ